jgi:hypothetical protein
MEFSNAHARLLTTWKQERSIIGYCTPRDTNGGLGPPVGSLQNRSIRSGVATPTQLRAEK